MLCFFYGSSTAVSYNCWLFQVKAAYIHFLIESWIDDEVEVKELYSTQSMWRLFENFLTDIELVSFFRCYIFVIFSMFFSE